MATPSNGPRVTCLGQVVIALFIFGCLGGAGYLFYARHAGALFTSLSSTFSGGSGSNSGNSGNGGNGGNGGFFGSSSAPVTIGIAYGTEKKRWLNDVIEEFKKTPDGANITINLIPMGSVEGAQAIVSGDKRINVWFPASSVYKEQFVTDWQARYDGKNPVLREETMALTPMAFVFWKERYDAFVAKYQEVNFSTIGQAVQEKGGWDTIAQKPDWGLFKFGHTHPNKSNSGLCTLILMSYEYHRKNKGLEMKDILDTGFQGWMNQIENGVSGLSDSTGNMMKDMVLRGPSTYDCLLVYESTAIDFLSNASGRWGDLKVVYPKQNMWNDNPYYILDADWSTPEQRKAAGVFADYLLSEPIQKEALVHGFRPGNTSVPILFPESPFTKDTQFGIRVDVGQICDTPKPEVINNLLEGWQRSQGSR